MYAFYPAEPHYEYVDSKHITRMSDSFHSRSKLIFLDSARGNHKKWHNYS